MTSDRFDFDEVFGEDAESAASDRLSFLELNHDQLMILVSALHSQWPGADLGPRLAAAAMCQARIQEMSLHEMVMFAKKLVAFHNSFHKE